MANEFGVEIDDLTVLSRLGRGGMASVFLAREESLGRLVALKVIDDRLDDDADMQARFAREARTVASLTHPNIVPTYRYGIGADGRPFLTMAFLDGGSLRDRLRKRGALPVEEALAITRQIAAALALAHSRKVVHRDLKPDNILFQGDAAYLTDFGIAKLVDATRLTRPGQNPGTVRYFSPEQALEKPVDASSDIYALGVVLYEALTAKLPIDAETVTGLLMRIAYEAPAPLPVHLRGLQPFLDVLLAKDPGDRLASCTEVVSVIQAMERNWLRSADPDHITDGVSMVRSRVAPAARASVEDATLPLPVAGAPARVGEARVTPAAEDAAGFSDLGPSQQPQAPPAPIPAVVEAGPVRSVPGAEVAPAAVADIGGGVVGAPAAGHGRPGKGRRIAVSALAVLGVAIGLAATYGTLEHGSPARALSALVVEYLREDVEFQDALRDGGGGPWMAVVPTGRFRLRSDVEAPVPARTGASILLSAVPRDAIVEFARPFAIAAHEITFDEFDRFSDATGRPRVVGAGGRGPLPVVNVAWSDAVAYAAWLSEQTGAHYRLPTETEWEYAARAGSNTAYSWGDDVGDGRVNCAGCATQDAGKPWAPGNSSSNVLGVAGMHGNVAEWVEDCFSPTYANTPLDGSAHEPAVCFAGRVVRGGSYADPPARVTTRSRVAAPPGVGNERTGFRVVRELDATEAERRRRSFDFSALPSDDEPLGELVSELRQWQQRNAVRNADR